jgi:IMP dehydrogenase
MDTVTESLMAIAAATAGGLGIIHRNLDPKAQAREVGRVKHRLHGRISTPFTVDEEQSVQSVLDLCERKKLLFRSFPVIGNGKMVGLITGYDFDNCENTELPVKAVMTPLHQLRTGQPCIDREEAYRILKSNKLRVLPLVDEKEVLCGLYLASDLKRLLSSQKTDHNLDSEGRLRVGAAVGVGDAELARAETLVAEHCDVLVVDSAHGASKDVIDMVRLLKQRFPATDIVAGNVSHADGAKRLADAGADGIRIGQGGGSICTTRMVAGIGVPQVSAIGECAMAIASYDIPICADGGIRNSGDSVIAFAVGAENVMLGRLLAGTKETPGEIRGDGDKRVKVYRGMGSMSAMQDSAASRARYGQSGDPAKLVAEGVEAFVAYRGEVQSVIDQHIGGICSGFGYQGARTIAHLQERAEIFRMSPAALAESHPHGVALAVPSPSYNG